MMSPKLFCTLSKRMNAQDSLSRWLIIAARLVNSLQQLGLGQWYSFC